MGKQLIQQRRGRGKSLTFRSPGHRFIGKISYPLKHGTNATGEVVDIIDAPGRNAPVMKVMIDNKSHLMLAPADVSTGTAIAYTDDEKQIKTGNVLPIGKIPEGTGIFNVEKNPGDGGRFCRSAGSSAVLIRRGVSSCDVMMPSKKVNTLSALCRATIGSVAGEGVSAKPLRKAGFKYYKMRAVNRYYPIVSASSMNAVNHPFGGKTNPGRQKTISRNAPPGQKVGSFGARQTGRKKAKKTVMSRNK